MAAKPQRTQREREVAIIKRCIAVTAFFMLAEIVVGYQFNVLSLVADSYHMMNDLVAFVLQLYARQVSRLSRSDLLRLLRLKMLADAKRQSSAFSYGFGRVEFLANLMQAVLLVALCLSLALESLQRLYSPEHITMPPLVIGLGCLALAWNGWILWYFEKDTHNEPSATSHSIAHPKRYRKLLSLAGQHARHDLATAATSTREVDQSHLDEQRRPSKKRALASKVRSAVPKPSSALGLHAFGDAMGNIAVIFDGTATLLFGPKLAHLSGLWATWDGIPYVDPLCSLIVVYVIFTHALPLLTASSFALMQAYDPEDIGKLEAELRGVGWLPRNVADSTSVSLLDLHVWKLSKQQSFATVRLEARLRQSFDDRRLAQRLSELRHAAQHALRSVAPPSQIVVEVDVQPARPPSFAPSALHSPAP